MDERLQIMDAVNFRLGKADITIDSDDCVVQQDRYWQRKAQADKSELVSDSHGS